MKTKTTDKALKERCTAIYSLHTNYLDKLLRWMSPTYYSTDRIGHRYDVYIMGTVALTTGRKAIGADVPPEALRMYEEEAASVSTIEGARALAEKIAAELAPEQDGK